MSVRVMSAVFYADLPPNEKILLLALADCASDDGTSVYPSQARMAIKASMSVRTIRRLLDALAARHLLHEVRPAGFHHPTEYRLDLERIQELQIRPDNLAGHRGRPDNGDRGDRPNDAPRPDTGVRQSVSSNPSVDPSGTTSPCSPPHEQEQPGIEPPTTAENGHSAWGDVDPLVTLWNDEAPKGLPRVRDISDGRRKKARASLRQFPHREWWEQVMREYRASSFLQGLKNGRDHEHFKADFDWLMAKSRDGTENAVRVHEGRYRDGVEADEVYGGKWG